MRFLFPFFLLLCTLVATSCNSTKLVSQTPTSEVRSGKQQGARPGGPNPEVMIRQLGLTDEQAVSFREISQRYGTKANEIRQTSGDDRQAMRSKMESLRASQDKEINAILTTEQQKAYAKIQAEQEANRPAGGGSPGGGPGGQGGGRPGGGL